MFEVTYLVTNTHPSPQPSTTPCIPTYTQQTRSQQHVHNKHVHQNTPITNTQLYDYAGESTCAADGMCQEKCPVKINTGELIKSLRAEHMKDDRVTSGWAMVCGGVLCEKEGSFM